MRHRFLSTLALVMLVALPATAHNRTLTAPNIASQIELSGNLDRDAEIVSPPIITDVPDTLPVFTRSRKLASGFFGLRAEPNIQRTLDLGTESRLGDDFMHARYYNPNLGRFLSVDPRERRDALSLPQGWNRYSYTQNNPLKYLDPDGEETKLAIGLRTDSNPVGHVAIIIDDKVYSFGTNYSQRGEFVQDWGASAQVYLDGQAARRQTDLLTLGITPEQENELRLYLNANNPNARGAPTYDELTNSCTTVTQRALVKTETMPNVVVGGHGQIPGPRARGGAILPATVGGYATGAGLVNKVETVGEKPKVSWFRTIVNAVRDYF